MLIDQTLSPAIRTLLSTYTVSTQTVGGVARVMDFTAARNNGLLAKSFGPGFEINARLATSGGAATATLTLVTDDNAALSSPATLYTSPTFTLAQMVKMDLFVPMPDTDLFERFLAWRIAVGVAVFTGGILSIEFVGDKRSWRGYPSTTNR